MTRRFRLLVGIAVLLAGCTPESIDAAPPTTVRGNASPAIATADSVPPGLWKVVLVAGDNNSPAFDNGVEAMRDKLAARGVRDIKVLTSDPGANPGVPPATASNVSNALRAPGGEACLAFVTSHGDETGFVLRQARGTVAPNSLASALDAGCGTRPTVVVVSACHSGVFMTPAMRRPNRIVITAAAADRVRREGLAGRDAIPALPERRDEIGDLADSLKAMTATLYDRIGATERFAADVAHELKNPLTSLASAMEMLVRAPDDATRQKLMALVRADVKRIDRLITDISDASRLDAELSRERHSAIELSHLLKTIVEIYDITEISKGQTVTLLDELPPGIRIMGNDERLGQVFRNLIDNAISFNPVGGVITIRAQRNHGAARVTVEDRGPGIPPDNLESIFERFYTERPAMHFGNNSGLGLSIARQITENASGRIWAENVDGGGARFVVEFPVLP